MPRPQSSPWQWRAKRRQAHLDACSICGGAHRHQPCPEGAARKIDAAHRGAALEPGRRRAPALGERLRDGFAIMGSCEQDGADDRRRYNPDRSSSRIRGADANRFLDEREGDE